VTECELCHQASLPSADVVSIDDLCNGSHPFPLLSSSYYFFSQQELHFTKG
jgi:hypothetical protein